MEKITRKEALELAIKQLKEAEKERIETADEEARKIDIEY